MSALADIRATPGLDPYLSEIEARLADAVAERPGLAAVAGSDALAAGGKRLRPLLCFLAAPPDAEPPVAAAVAIELMHTASLVHDDLVDGAPLRRGHATTWKTHGDDIARATGDYLFARAFGVLAATGDLAAVAILADTALHLVRGEALQRTQQHDPDTSVEAYFERIALKTGKLFAAACVLGGGPALAPFGLALGVAFQIADDILDCSGDTADTGKIPGTDLREGTPTLPLLLAAREDEVVRRALAGGSLEGALVRVGASGALARSREVALDYALRARESLDGCARREELETLTFAVVERER
jgi:geranylgeranyl pyrophosphate synthase